MATQESTTVIIQRHLDCLTGQTDARAVGELLDQATRRLLKRCGGFLYGRYPRLAEAPMNLTADELLGGVVRRLLVALDEIRPTNVRQFFGLANRHIIWELNDLARRLDEEPSVGNLPPDLAGQESSASCLSISARRILEAIEGLPDEEREVFELVEIQGLAQAEVARILGLNQPKTVSRRLRRAKRKLADQLGDLAPPSVASEP